MKIIVYVALGGALGSVLRYMVGWFISKWIIHPFPWATLLINFFGSLLIGFFWGILEKNTDYSDMVRFFLMTGICGGFTTFSTFSLEGYQLIHSQQYGYAALYFVTSIVLGVMAVVYGLYLSK